MPYIPRALNLGPDEGEPSYRMSMLPFGTYPNENGQGEHLGFAVPGAIQEPVNALMNLFGHGNFAKGPDYPGNADDMRTLLFSMYGGNALSPSGLLEGAAARGVPVAERAAAGELFSDIGKPSIPGVVVAGAEGPQRAYRGSLNPENIARENAATLWGSSSPDVASTYARAPYGDGPVGSVAPADFSFQNPLVVDANGNSWMNIPYDGFTTNADSLAFRARTNGHDGLIIQNVQDAANRIPGEAVLPTATTYAALKRGTVTSPLTGETLFSDTGKPSIPGAIVAGSERLPDDYWDYARRATSTIPGRDPLSVNRPYVMHGNAPIDEADRMFAQIDQHIPVDMPTNELAAFETPYDRAVTEQAWRDKIKRTGELYSDIGRPSLMGSALSPYSQPPRNSLLDY